MRSPRSLPKTDLHVHYQGSARAETVRELAERHGVPLPSSLAAGRYVFTDEDLEAIARAGVAPAFLAGDEQQSLMAEIDAWLATHTDPLQEPSR